MIYNRLHNLAVATAEDVNFIPGYLEPVHQHLRWSRADDLGPLSITSGTVMTAVAG